jgi:AraC-like DNA-binding protein
VEIDDKLSLSDMEVGIEMYNHPKPRNFEFVEILPNVHWAQIQHAYRNPGQFRAIYDFELIYLFQGELQIHFTHDADRIHAGAGDLLLLPSAIRHRIEIITEPNTLLMGIHFDFFNELSTLAEQDITVQDNKVYPERFCSMPVTEAGNPAFSLYYQGIPYEMVEWMERIVMEHSRGNPGSDMACRGLMLLILTFLWRFHSKSNRPNLHSEYREMMHNLALEIEGSPGDPWPNAAMASRCNVSEDHFIRLFKDIIGMSPHKYLQFIRHREAKKLLRETAMKIELIGRKLGYEDLHNFSKVFKKWQGISPRAYRKLSIMH